MTPEPQHISPSVLPLDIPLGVEVGSLSTFFSRQNPSLGQVRLRNFSEWTDPLVGECFSAEVQMPDAHLKIEEVRTARTRTLCVTALEDSWVMDAVLRYELPLTRGPKVALNGVGLEWKRENKYHQVEACPATVTFEGQGAWTFTLTDGEVPAGMSFLTYFRDEPDRWILHFRARAEHPDKMAIRGCMRWFNRPFPAWVQALIACWPALGVKTLYLRERISQRIPFQTNGAVRLAKGQRIKFSVTVNTKEPSQ